MTRDSAAVIDAWIASDEAADALDAHCLTHEGEIIDPRYDMLPSCVTCAALDAAYEAAFSVAAILDR